MSFRIPVFSFIFYIFTLGMVFPASVRGEDVLARIALANDFYAKAKYQQAADIYQTLIDDGHKNGYLYYNLGNSFLRLGKFGPSILNYIRAKQFLPRNESLNANLRTAILKTEDQLELPSTSGLGSIFFWVDRFTLNEQLFLFGITNLIFWLVLGIWMVRKTALLNLLRKGMMVILLISILSIGVKINLDSEITIGVILARNIEVKSARGANNVTLFQLHEGSVVTILDSQSHWYHIKLNDGKKGWAQKDSIGI